MSKTTAKKFRVVVVFGTRPEAIKLAPVIRALRAKARNVEMKIAVTGQHRHMLDQVLGCFRITPDADLAVMRPNQSLGDLTGRVLRSVERLVETLTPDLLMVQGDTTSAFVTALAGFYHRIPVAHVEAGLRSRDLRNPFPEEANRRLTSIVTALHLAPTLGAARALLAEGVPHELVAITGNTVVDALQILLETPFSFEGTPLKDVVRRSYRVILVTSHRRESWGHDLEEICSAVRDVVREFPDVAVVFPVHLNPNVEATVRRRLQGVERVFLTQPLDYLTFINLAKQSYLILTDSGGVQEEAPTLGKPLLLLRKVTERPEAFEAGQAAIVGTSRTSIARAATRLLSDERLYASMAHGPNPYGDGRAAERIALAIQRWRDQRRPLLPPRSEFRVAVRPAVVPLQARRRHDEVADDLVTTLGGP